MHEVQSRHVLLLPVLPVPCPDRRPAGSDVPGHPVAMRHSGRQLEIAPAPGHAVTAAEKCSVDVFGKRGVDALGEALGSGPYQDVLSPGASALCEEQRRLLRARKASSRRRQRLNDDDVAALPVQFGKKRCDAQTCDRIGRQGAEQPPLYDDPGASREVPAHFAVPQDMPSPVYRDKCRLVVGRDLTHREANGRDARRPTDHQGVEQIWSDLLVQDHDVSRQSLREPCRQGRADQRARQPLSGRTQAKASCDQATSGRPSLQGEQHPRTLSPREDKHPPATQRAACSPAHMHPRGVRGVVDQRTVNQRANRRGKVPTGNRHTLS